MSEAQTAQSGEEDDVVVCTIVEDGEMCGKEFRTDEHARARDYHADHIGDAHQDYLQNMIGGVNL